MRLRTRRRRARAGQSTWDALSFDFLDAKRTMTIPLSPLAVKSTHPIVFMFLFAPFGAMSGYLTVAIAYLLTQSGVSVEEVAGLIALSYVPHSWKFLWAPVADTTLSRKAWYVLAGAVSALGIFVTGVVPAEAKSLPIL